MQAADRELSLARAATAKAQYHSSEHEARSADLRSALSTLTAARDSAESSLAAQRVVCESLAAKERSLTSELQTMTAEVQDQRAKLAAAEAGLGALRAAREGLEESEGQERRRTLDR